MSKSILIEAIKNLAEVLSSSGKGQEMIDKEWKEERVAIDFDKTNIEGSFNFTDYLESASTVYIGIENLKDPLPGISGDYYTIRPHPENLPIKRETLDGVLELITDQKAKKKVLKKFL